MGHNQIFLYQMRLRYDASVIAMEYPGYGFYSRQIVNGATTQKKMSCSPGKIKENALLMFKHVTTPIKEGGLGYEVENIILFGRSMGTGPASLVASQNQVKGLVLMSAYTTIK